MNLDRIRGLVTEPTAKVHTVVFLAGLWSLPAGFQLFRISWLPLVTPLAITVIVSGSILTVWSVWQIPRRLSRWLPWFTPDHPMVDTSFARLFFVAGVTSVAALLTCLLGPILNLDPWLVGLAVWYLLIAFMAGSWAYLHRPKTTDV